MWQFCLMWISVQSGKGCWRGGKGRWECSGRKADETMTWARNVKHCWKTANYTEFNGSVRLSLFHWWQNITPCRKKWYCCECVENFITRRQTLTTSDYYWGIFPSNTIWRIFTLLPRLLASRHSITLSVLITLPTEMVITTFDCRGTALKVLKDICSCLFKC